MTQKPLALAGEAPSEKRRLLLSSSQVFVHLPTGKTIELDIPGDATVDEVALECEGDDRQDSVVRI